MKADFIYLIKFLFILDFNIENKNNIFQKKLKKYLYL